MEILETGVITIKPHKLDIKAKGSFRAARDITRVAHGAVAGDPAAFESMLDAIIANCDIEVSEGVRRGNLRDLLLDELSFEEAKEILAAISGKGVSPTNGALSEAG